MQVNQNHQLVFESDGRTIVLGEGADSLGTIRPARGETARPQISRSLLSWPTPLAVNFMTGVSPSWKRHLYYRSKMFVAFREAASKESGDFIAAEAIPAEIGEVLAKTKPGRTSPNEITLFKAVGVAIEDVVAANLVYQRALGRA